MFCKTRLDGPDNSRDVTKRALYIDQGVPPGLAGRPGRPAPLARRKKRALYKNLKTATLWVAKLAMVRDVTKRAHLATVPNVEVLG